MSRCGRDIPHPAHRYFIGATVHRCEGGAAMSVNPYLGVDPRLAWMLKVLSDEFGMLGVLRAQQAAFDYLESRGAVDNRMRPWDEEDASPDPSIPRPEVGDHRPADKGPCEYHVCEFCGEIWDRHGRLEGR